MAKYNVYRVDMLKNNNIYPNSKTDYYNLFYMACPADVKDPKKWMLNVAVKRAGFESIDEYINTFPHQFNNKTSGGSLYVTTKENEHLPNPTELFLNSIGYNYLANWYAWIIMLFIRTQNSKGLSLISHMTFSINEAIGSLHITDRELNLTRNDLWFCDDWCEE